MDFLLVERRLSDFGNVNTWIQDTIPLQKVHINCKHVLVRTNKDCDCDDELFPSMFHWQLFSIQTSHCVVVIRAVPVEGQLLLPAIDTIVPQLRDSTSNWIGFWSDWTSSWNIWMIRSAHSWKYRYHSWRTMTGITFAIEIMYQSRRNVL